MGVRKASDSNISGKKYNDASAGQTKVPDVPDAPTIGAVTDLGTGTSVTVAYTAAATGGAVTTFTATSTPGSITGTGASSPITVSGLSVGTAYTFKVKGTNATGVVGPESVASNSLTLAFPIVGSYDALASVTIPVGQTASSIDFAGIPTGYKHLEMRYISRGSISAAFTNVNFRFNGDNGTNYRTHWLDATGSGTPIGEASGQDNLIYIGVGTGANANASVFGAGVISILDYANTNKYKTCRSLAGEDNNGSGFLGLISGLWMNSSAITTITIIPNSGTFNAYTSFALYGIK